ncbi:MULTISPECIES: hypothetical protein [unclassified Archaeoglobus]|jgi:hypothetical protein|uniref:hypothetical protein n=1 Tax=unclassified Archaeoglobus TaxID=2643606 RepID=UPI0025BDE1CA|nr:MULTISPECIES: hypothetical protein [unclassified Archaeoglobus]
MVLNAVIGITLLNTRNMELGMLLLSLLPLTLVLIPDAFTSSLLLRMGVSGKEVFVFYFWFLVSVALAFLFLLPTGGNPTEILPPKTAWFRLIVFPLLYTEFALPSTLCLVFQRIRTFLVFIPLPVILGYMMMYSLRV